MRGDHGPVVIRMKPFDAKTTGLLLDSVSTLAYLQERYRQGTATGLQPVPKVRNGEGTGLGPYLKGGDQMVCKWCGNRGARYLGNGLELCE